MNLQFSLQSLKKNNIKADGIYGNKQIIYCVKVTKHYVPSASSITAYWPMELHAYESNSGSCLPGDYEVLK